MIELNLDPPTGELAGLGGVRLGRVERTLLMAAPRLDAPGGGLKLVGPEHTRSAQQSYLRAAKKLRALKLLHGARINEPTRARDQRREAPVYARGSFWERADPTRAQVVKRWVIWVTPFGEGIRMAYERELTSRLPVRWTKDRVGRAQRYAEAATVSSQRHEEALWSYQLSDEDVMNDPKTASLLSIEVFPEAVESRGQQARWRAAVRAARRDNPQLGSSTLWKAAEKLFDSGCSSEELAALGGPARAQTSEAPLKFTRIELAGTLISTDPAVRREQIARGELPRLSRATEVKGPAVR